MSYQIITSITVVSDGDAGRIIGKPDAFLLVHINIIDIVSVHSIITIIISCYIGLAHTCVHIQFIYTSATRSYQKFMIVQGDNPVYLYIIG